MAAVIFGVVGSDTNSLDGALNRLERSSGQHLKTRALSITGDAHCILARAELDPDGAGAAATEASRATAGFVADAALYAPETATGAHGEARLRDLWLREGVAGLARANGDFAFAHWDPGTSTLTLGRDHMGVRPLFYVHRPGEFFAFASFATLLVDAGFASGEPDVETAALAARGKFTFGRRSFLKGVFRVAPAHVLEVRDGRVDDRRYWRLTCENPISRNADFGATARELRAVLERAVRRRTAASERVASDLSSGLDSQSIAILAARGAGGPPKPTVGYCITAPAVPTDLHIIDESTRAAIAAQNEPELSVRFVASQDQAAAVLGELAAEGPYPLSPDDPRNRLIADAAASGARTILSGYGGDQMLSFNGLGTTTEQLLGLRWRRLWSHLTERSAKTGRARYKILMDSVDMTLLPPRVSGFLRGLVNKRRDGWDPFDASLRTSGTWTRYRPNTRTNRLALIEAGGTLEHVFDDLAWRAARFGMAYSFPMLDREALEFGIRLPAEFFFDDGENRAIFREAMRGVLPEAVRTASQRVPTDPTTGLSLAMNKETLKAALDRPAGSARAAELFQFDVIKERLDRLPSAEARTEAINRDSAEGRLHDTRDALFSWQIMLSRWLAGEREADPALGSIRRLGDQPQPSSRDARGAPHRRPRRRRAG